MKIVLKIVGVGVALFFFAIVWQAGHQGDVRRAHAEGRTCSDWAC